jgi:diguanylate cyclase (GGDEF)-like protein
VTISIGASERTGQRAASNQVLKAADQALYRAKKAGRNQVCG